MATIKATFAHMGSYQVRLIRRDSRHALDGDQEATSRPSPPSAPEQRMVMSGPVDRITTIGHPPTHFLRLLHRESQLSV